MVNRLLVFAALAAMLSACSPVAKQAVGESGGLTAEDGSAPDTTQFFAEGIAAYIRAVRSRDGLFPHTLYIGRHADFPHIELPRVLEGTSIRVVNADTVAALQDDTRTRYLNVFGWINGVTAEFKIFSFGASARHWPDGRDDADLVLTYQSEKRVYALVSLVLGGKAAPQ